MPHHPPRSLRCACNIQFIRAGSEQAGGTPETTRRVPRPVHRYMKHSGGGKAMQPRLSRSQRPAPWARPISAGVRGRRPVVCVAGYQPEAAPGLVHDRIADLFDAAHGNAKLYFDYGEGYSEWASGGFAVQERPGVQAAMLLAKCSRQVRLTRLKGRPDFRGTPPLLACCRCLRTTACCGVCATIMSITRACRSGRFGAICRRRKNQEGCRQGTASPALQPHFPCQ